MTTGTANNLPTPRKAAVKRPRIVYSWVTIRTSKAAARRNKTSVVRVECIWSIVAANGESLCTSWPEGFRDKTDAQRAVETLAQVFMSDGHYDMTKAPFREVGPGPKPMYTPDGTLLA